LLICISLSGCNTLYNSHLIDIEIVEPGKFLLPKKYSTAAIKYNNCNVAYNPTFASYFVDSLIEIDKSNIDSIAAEIYYYSFVQQLRQQIYFDSIVEISPGNYSNTYLTYLSPHAIKGQITEKQFKKQLRKVTSVASSYNKPYTGYYSGGYPYTGSGGIDIDRYSILSRRK